MSETINAESFSLKSAEECAQAIFNALPTKKKYGFIGELNEILVVLSRVRSADRNKEYTGK